MHTFSIAYIATVDCKFPPPPPIHAIIGFSIFISRTLAHNFVSLLNCRWDHTIWLGIYVLRYSSCIASLFIISFGNDIRIMSALPIARFSLVRIVAEKLFVETSSLILWPKQIYRRFCCRIHCSLMTWFMNCWANDWFTVELNLTFFCLCVRWWICSRLRRRSTVWFNCGWFSWNGEIFRFYNFYQRSTHSIDSMNK